MFLFLPSVEALLCMYSVTQEQVGDTAKFEPIARGLLCLCPLNFGYKYFGKSCWNCWLRRMDPPAHVRSAWGHFSWDTQLSSAFQRRGFKIYWTDLI